MTLSDRLNVPAYTVHVGAGKSHVAVLTTTDREAAYARANFERQLNPVGVPVLLEVTA